MKRSLILTYLALSPIYVMTACSEPAGHIFNINLKNDLGRQVELSLCKDDLHCESISDLWTPKKIGANEMQSFTVSNEETTVFKVASENNAKRTVRCLRVRSDESLKKTHELLLSSATAC